MRPLLLSVLIVSISTSVGPAEAQTSCPTGQLFPQAVNYPSGTYALAVVAADFTGDLIPDLAVANYGEGTISILPGRGDGTFLAKAAIATGSGPRNLAVGDFDKDGKLDIAVTNLNANAVTVLLGNGTGSFAAASVTPIADPRGIAIADFNNDGILDLVVTGSEGVTVLLGQGSGGVWNGTLHPTGPYPASNPWAVAPGDFNGDGIPDFAVANLAASYVSVFLGHGQGGVGDGTFLAGQQVTVPGGQVDILAKDLNGDGILDLAAPAGNQLAVMIGLGVAGIGNGQFQTTVFPSTPDHNGIATADLDSDNRPDLVITDPTNNQVIVYRNAGAGSFSPFESYPVAAGSVGLTAADLNRDGAVDLAVTCSGPGSVAIFLNRCPPPPPSIADVHPRLAGVGELVTILGGHLGGVTSVRFTGADAIIVTLSADAITTRVPLGATTGPITVVAPYGTATTTFDFSLGRAPRIDSATPSAAKPSSVVVIVGQFFTGATLVRFGAGGAASFTVDSDVQITATVDLGATTGPISVKTPIGTGLSSFDFSVTPLDYKAAIVNIRDVPFDQGGKVVVRWLRSDYDLANLRTVLGYRVWRRAPLGLSAMNSVAPTTRLRPKMTSTGAVVYWEPLADLPAAGLDGYAFTAATTQDSTDAGNPYTAFFIQTLTGDQFSFFESNVDSGYSVDNTAPHKPPKLTADYEPANVSLAWGGNQEADLAGYRLYRGSNVDFTPSASTLIYSGSDTTFTDSSGGANVYKLSAVDIHGNESRFALATPNGVTTSVAFAVSVKAQPFAVTLNWYVIGIPSAVVSLQRRNDSSPWQQIANLVADGVGMVRYRDESVRPGQKLSYRLATTDGGEELVSDEVSVTVPQAQLVIMSIAPNPVSLAQRVTLSLSLPEAGRLGFEVYDASGRIVSARDLGWRDAGEQVERVNLGDRLGAGIYWVRLKQREKAVTTKVCVLGQ